MVMNYSVCCEKFGGRYRTDQRIREGKLFKVAPPKLPSYLAPDATDRDVKGEISLKPLISKGAQFVGGKTFELGSWGFWISKITSKPNENQK